MVNTTSNKVKKGTYYFHLDEAEKGWYTFSLMLPETMKIVYRSAGFEGGWISQIGDSDEYLIRTMGGTCHHLKF